MNDNKSPLKQRIDSYLANYQTDMERLPMFYDACKIAKDALADNEHLKELVPEWITLKELPPQDIEISIVVNGKSCGAIFGEDIHGCLCFTTLDGQFDFGDIRYNVTHWQPLPKPPITKPS
jgi:hypothetical protein